MGNEIVKASLKWREITDRKEEMEERLLKLLAHEDTDGEQLRQAHEAYVHVCTLYAKAKEALMAKYPDRKGGFMPYPWNIRG